MDKPKSLSEQLTELAERAMTMANARVNQGWMTWAEELADVADEVRDMAEGVKGKVLAPVNYVGPSTEGDLWDAWVAKEAVEAVGRGATKEEAIANLQSLVDQQKGR